MHASVFLILNSPHTLGIRILKTPGFFLMERDVRKRLMMMMMMMTLVCSNRKEKTWSRQRTVGISFRLPASEPTAVGVLMHSLLVMAARSGAWSSTWIDCIMYRYWTHCSAMHRHAITVSNVTIHDARITTTPRDFFSGFLWSVRQWADTQRSAGRGRGGTIVSPRLSWWKIIILFLPQE